MPIIVTAGLEIQIRQTETIAFRRNGNVDFAVKMLSGFPFPPVQTERKCDPLIPEPRNNRPDDSSAEHADRSA